MVYQSFHAFKAMVELLDVIPLCLPHFEEFKNNFCVLLNLNKEFFESLTNDKTILSYVLSQCKLMPLYKCKSMYKKFVRHISSPSTCICGVRCGTSYVNLFEKHQVRLCTNCKYKRLISVRQMCREYRLTKSQVYRLLKKHVPKIVGKDQYGGFVYSRKEIRGIPLQRIE